MIPPSNNPNRSTRRPRRGAVLLLTVVCVAVSLSILAGLVRVALLRRATQKNHIRAAQAACLVESGMDRAAASLAADPAYKGETWKIPATDFNSTKPQANGQPALVRIEIKTVADNPSKREIHIRADYTDAPKLRARRSKQVSVSLLMPKPKNTEPKKSEPPKNKPKNPDDKKPDTKKPQPEKQDPNNQ